MPKCHRKPEIGVTTASGPRSCVHAEPKPGAHRALRPSRPHTCRALTPPPPAPALLHTSIYSAAPRQSESRVSPSHARGDHGSEQTHSETVDNLQEVTQLAGSHRGGLCGANTWNLGCLAKAQPPPRQVTPSAATGNFRYTAVKPPRPPLHASPGESCQVRARRGWTPSARRPSHSRAWQRLSGRGDKLTLASPARERKEIGNSSDLAV